MQWGNGNALVAVKAGLLRPYEGKLSPDKRRGLLRVAVVEPNVRQLQWCERSSDGACKDPEEDLLVVPQADDLHIKQIGNPLSRCYALELNGRDILFFWMQETDAAQDDARIKQLAGALADPLEGEDMEEEEGEEAGEPQEAGAAALAAQMPPGAAGAVSAAAAAFSPAAAGQRGAVTAGNLASILGNIMGGTGGQQDAMAAMQQYMRAPGPSLAEVLTPETIAPLLGDDAALQRLAEHLPEAHRTREGLIGTAYSPQFQQQLAAFSHALQTGELDLAQFGLDARGFTVADFLESIQDSVEKERAAGGGQGGPQ
mmetsp:Transcript_42247/g.100221  ORF Transcript_42247/g.100221 Transcript_42247/m.100221 type:complete len:314 (-) Transcript_42247:181-1122(-)